MSKETEHISLDIHQAVHDLFAFLEEHPEMKAKLSSPDELELVEVHLAFLKWLETNNQRN